MENSWTPESWQKLTAEQQPDWENNKDYLKVLSEIADYPPLVFAGEVAALKQQLADAAKGNVFLYREETVQKPLLISGQT